MHHPGRNQSRRASVGNVVRICGPTAAVALALTLSSCDSTEANDDHLQPEAGEPTSPDAAAETRPDEPPPESAPATEASPPAAEASPPAAGTAAEEEPSGYAILPRGTPLRTRPDPEAPAIDTPALPPFPRDFPLPGPPRGTVVMITGVDGDFLEIETVAATDKLQHCEATMQDAAAFRLRMYAPRRAPQLVTRRAVNHAAQDGSRVRLPPGVPVRRSDDDPDAWIASALGVRVKLPLVPEDRGYFYEPGPAFDRDPTPERLSKDGPLRFDGQPLQGREFLFGGSQAHVYEKHGPRIAVANECVTVEGRTEAPPGPFDPDVEGSSFEQMVARHYLPRSQPREALASPASAAYGPGGGLGTAPADEPYHVTAGTPVYWEDGRVAGQAVADYGWSDEAETIGRLSCIALDLGGVESYARVCFEPGAIHEAPAFGSGIAGLYGHAHGGLGSGRRVPKVRTSKASVKGALDKDIIRRIVRAHINEVRYCYNQGLARDPSLTGRVAVQFTIGPTGKVPVAVVAKTSLTDRKVANCIAKAVKRWKFPKPPGGGNAVVTYPFVLTPG